MPFAWPGLSWAWLGLAFCRWFLHPFSFFWVKFMQMPKADGKRERKREEECGKWATNALRNFRTKSVREREGAG